ncbi:MAG: argininosuccinate synthase [Lachnospiraceae bacterium]|nr:argininosuccinate synthase [Sarcina sp.]MBR2730105.1 argininosuccinate synthase [Lachnospiraceae bacterium]
MGAANEKVILAYSGGLDTTAIIPWLKENYGYDVICVCIDCGQEEELDHLEDRAKYCGAEKLYILDVTDEFADEYIVPCIQAHAVYENKYLLGTSMARPLIAKKLVEIARKEGATTICHGATGKGNDQIRFELGIKALAPDLKIIAAWRSPKWTMDSRESEIEYCKAHGIELPFSADSSYSRDRNLWHISHEGLELEDPANEPNYDHLLVLSQTPMKAPDAVTYVTLTFEAGVPKTLNGEAMKVSDIIRKLNKIGGENGIGIIDIVENRVVGMKSRGIYETPGGTILMEAHQQLEELILDRDTYAVKDEIGHKFASLVYEGKWFSPLREAEQAFIESTQKYVTGEVKIGLYKGNIIKAGTKSPYSLYSESLASFTTGDLYDHHDAEGFITLFGLSTKVRAMKMQEMGLL